MRKRENSDRLVPLQIHRVVWEPFHGYFAGRHVGWQAIDTTTDLRPFGDLRQGMVNPLDELQAKAWPLALIPEGGVFEFGGGFGFLTECGVHRSVNRWTTRARTSSHGSPTDSPLMTRRALRSIS